MPDPLDWLDDELADLDSRGLLRKLQVRCGPQRPERVEVGGQSLVNFGSNDYLGLANDPRVVAAAKAAVEEFGFGSGASPLVTGRSHLHAELERKLAEFEGTEAALLFPTGYAANVGTIAALVGKGDAIYSDELNHASIIDGCRLSGAALHVYRHRDVQHLRELLAAPPPHPRLSDIRRRLIVTDSLFSMHGDIAPLHRLVDIANEFGAMLMVDEAHATGVIGVNGRGVCDHPEVKHRVPVRVGTLSKALGSSGGFVAGSQRLIDWLANRARPYVFSTAAPAATAAAGLAALKIAIEEPQHREYLFAQAHDFRAKLRFIGFNVDASQSQIISIVLGDAASTLAAAGELRRRGMFVPGIRPPSVPPGQSLLRISLTCLHTEQHLEDLIAALAEVVG